jgi:hypothetical protein
VRVRVEILEPATKSRSRNVNRAVRATLTVRAMRAALGADAVTARMQAIAALTGGQKAETERILREMGVSMTHTDTSSESRARAIDRPR